MKSRYDLTSKLSAFSLAICSFKIARIYSSACKFVLKSQNDTVFLPKSLSELRPDLYDPYNFSLMFYSYRVCISFII